MNKYLSWWLFLILVLTLYNNDRTDKLTAVQELQRQRYEQIELTNRIRFAAGIKTDCPIYQYGRLTFNTYDSFNGIRTVSVCVGLFSKPTFF